MGKAGMLNERKIPSPIITIASYFLILLPAALALVYVRLFGVNVPYWDQWWIVNLIGELEAGTLSVSDLWSQANEHRIFFPRIIMLLLGSLTRYNNVAEMYLIQGFFLFTLIILLLVFKTNVRANNARTTLLLFIPISFLLFSPRQWENMLWGFQMGFIIVRMFAVLTFYFLYILGYGKLRNIMFPAALLSATVASFSSAQGLFVWPAGLLQLFFSPVEKWAKKRLLVVWGLIGVVEWIFYFIGYTQPDKFSLSFVFDYPIAGADYSLTLLGSALFWQHSFAGAGGLFLVGLIVASLLLVYKVRRLGEYSFWIALLFFSLLIAASIIMGRSEAGATWAPISRYTSFTILIVISVYAMLTKLALERTSHPASVVLVGILSGFILLSAPVSYIEGAQAGKAVRAYREQAAFVLSTYETQSHKVLMKYLCPNPGCGALVRKRASILQRLDYNVFSVPRVRKSPPAPSGPPYPSPAWYGLPPGSPLNVS
jgi:hypothetical protein